MIGPDQKAIHEIETEYAKWAEFLNVGVGLFSFGLAISCLGSGHTYVTATISMLFVFLFMAYGRKKFPRNLREWTNATLDEIDEQSLQAIHQRYFGVRRIFRNFPVFLTGWLFLGGVAVFGFLK